MEAISEPIKGGYILLARKLLTSEVMVSPPLTLKLWIWFLLQASFKDHGNLKRGQFFTRLKDIQKAISYKIGFRTVRPTIKEIRGAMKVLMKSQMMGTMKVLHGMIVSISNYEYYQDFKNYEGHNEGQSKGHNEGTILRKKERNERKDPSAISEEIAFLASKLFPSSGEKELFYQVGEAISSIRKTGKVSPNIILAQLKAWEKYPVSQVHAGIKTYLAKEYYKEKKGEEYLLGIIRKSPQEEKRPQGFKSTGSTLLDSYYRKQDEQGGRG